MSQTRSYDIAGIDLSDTRYTVEQSIVGNRYVAEDSTGTPVLRGKQKLFSMKEEFPFTDADGADVFSVKAEQLVDVAGNYVLTDTDTGTDLVVLDNDYSVFRDTWTIRDAETEAALAKISARGAAVTLARHYLPLGGLIPHRYEITDVEGSHVGAIDGRLSLRDRYEIVIDDASTVPKEPVVAAAMVIDAIRGH